MHLLPLSLLLLLRGADGLAPPRWCDRRNALSVFAGGSASGLLLRPFPAAAASPLAPSSSSAVRGIAEQAGRVPGYGKPDIFYPPYFAGSWRLERTLVGYTLADELGSGKGLDASSDDAAVARRLVAEANALQGKAMPYRVRFFEHRGSLVADRTFNRLSYEKALAASLETASSSSSSSSSLAEEVKELTWDPDTPNILTVSYGSGLLREIKVTKRSFEEPAPGESFGSTEYHRIADTNTAGPLGSVPKLAACRTLVRYRRVAGGGDTATGGGGVSDATSRIEGLELLKYYPPVSLTSDPPPFLTIKSRLVFTRGE